MSDFSTEINTAVSLINGSTGAGEAIITDPILAAKAKYNTAYDRYQKAVKAYNDANFFDKIFVASGEKSAAEKELQEAETFLQNVTTEQQANEIRNTSNSFLQYWPILVAVLVCGVIIFILIKRKQ